MQKNVAILDEYSGFYVSSERMVFVQKVSALSRYPILVRERKKFDE